MLMIKELEEQGIIYPTKNRYMVYFISGEHTIISAEEVKSGHYFTTFENPSCYEIVARFKTSNIAGVEMLS